MKFFTSKIVTKPISLEDAIKNAKPAKVRSLDEIIASAKQVKTASTQVEAKPAVAEMSKESTDQKVEIKTAEFAKTDQTEVVSLPPAEQTKKEALRRLTDEEKAKLGISDPADVFVYTKREAGEELPGVLEGKGVSPIKEIPGKPRGYKLVPPGKVTKQPPMGVQPKPVGVPVSASGKKELKVASSINFTQWEEPIQVVDAWKQHGSLEACVKNVEGRTDDPQTYCSLLRVAAEYADKMVKEAAAKKLQKTAKASPAVSPMHKKIAKLNGEELGFLREYFSKIYGAEYVEALLGDF